MYSRVYISLKTVQRKTRNMPKISYR